MYLLIKLHKIQMKLLTSYYIFPSLFSSLCSVAAFRTTQVKEPSLQPLTHQLIFTFWFFIVAMIQQYKLVRAHKFEKGYIQIQCI